MTHYSGIALAALFHWALVANLADAAPVQISPPSLDIGAGVTGIAVQHPIGQTVLANGDSVQSVELLLLNLNMSADLSHDRYVTLTLFEGAGFGGRSLGQRTMDVDQILGGLVGTQGAVHFALGGISVTPGQTYSFQLSAATVRFGTVWFAGNPYANGQAILLGQSFDDPDLYFAIRAVPEPSRAMLFMAGVLTLMAPCVRQRLTRAPSAAR